VAVGVNNPATVTGPMLSGRYAAGDATTATEKNWFNSHSAWWCIVGG
jgi:hypothetical protein